MNEAQRKGTSSHLAPSDFLFLTYASFGPLKEPEKCVQGIHNTKTKQVFAQSFLRKMAYVTSSLLKLPGPLHPVSESLPSHQSRKTPLASGMFKYLAFLLSPWLRHRMRRGHVHVTLQPSASAWPLISPFVIFEDRQSVFIKGLSLNISYAEIFFSFYENAHFQKRYVENDEDDVVPMSGHKFTPSMRKKKNTGSTPCFVRHREQKESFM